MDTNLLRTPLFAAHQKHNARLVNFAGWEMPVLYTGILEEARAVRSSSGIFDISHMGRIQVTGEGATAMLQQLTSNDVAALSPSQAQYSLLTNPNGGIIDDIIVYRAGDEDYLVVINASNTEKDLAWIAQHTPATVRVEDNTRQTAMIAVQGPEAPALVARIAGRPDLMGLPRFHYVTGQIDGLPTIFCRTGYTGEDGFEVIVPATQAEALWDALLKGGAAACGLGARDALRIEAGYPLYGHEIDDTTSPVEACLMWAVKLDKSNFIGREAIVAAKAKPPVRRLVGLVTQERIQPRQGYTILVGNELVGEVTSGIFSPTKGTSVAMGYVAAPYAKTGTAVEIAIRDRRTAAIVVPKKNLLA